MSLQTIVSVNIVRGSRSITRAGFGTMLFLGTAATFPERFRTYETITGVGADFASNTNEFKAAQKYFAQERKPKKIMIGKQLPYVAQVNTFVVLVNVDGNYSVTINGVVHTFAAVANTKTQIRDGLIVAINAGSQNAAVTAALLAADSFTVTSDVAGNGFSASSSANVSNAASVANQGIIEDLQVISATLAGNDWYTLTIENKTTDNIMNAASYIETQRKVFMASTNEAGIKTNSATDVASKLKAKSYARSWAMFSGDFANYPEASLFGNINPRDPGSYTCKFKTLVGNVVDDLTESELGFIKGKNCNYYTQVAGVDIFQEGVVAVGEFIDTIIFIDWLQAQIEENVFADLVTNPKIPYTDNGFAIVEKQIRAQLQRGIAAGGLAQDPAYTVTVPKVADVAVLDRAARIAKTFSFNANLAGAIHFTEINGTVTV